jgi:[ribosomal protein S5]-alanine N-acetyltransferase
MARADTPLPTITTERLLLHFPDPSEASKLVDYHLSNRRHLEPWEPPFPAGIFSNGFWERQLQKNQTEYRNGLSLRLALRARARPSDKVLGIVNFTRFDRGVSYTCLLGYSIDEDEQGKGLMFEALSAGIQHVFEAMEMHRISAGYLPTNERSGRLLRRLGFQVEGYARDYLYINGCWRDHILTSRLNSQPIEPNYARQS